MVSGRHHKYQYNRFGYLGIWHLGDAMSQINFLPVLTALKQKFLHIQSGKVLYWGPKESLYPRIGKNQFNFFKMAAALQEGTWSDWKGFKLILS